MQGVRIPIITITYPSRSGYLVAKREGRVYPYRRVSQNRPPVLSCLIPRPPKQEGPAPAPWLPWLDDRGPPKRRKYLGAKLNFTILTRRPPDVSSVSGHFSVRKRQEISFPIQPERQHLPHPLGHLMSHESGLTLPNWT